MRGKTVEVKCERCREKFFVRVADRKRGWGKFCSKSCKAIKQTYGKHAFGPDTSYRQYLGPLGRLIERKEQIPTVDQD